PAVALPLSLHADADRGDALVHEHGPGPVSHGAGPRLRLGDPQVHLALVRAGDDAARVLGGPALALLARLRVLAVPIRRAYLLGRPVADGLGERARQARLLRHKRAHDPGWRRGLAARVRRIWRARRRGLPRPSLVQGLQGQPGLPRRPVGGRPRDHRAWHRVAETRGAVVDAPARLPARAAARADRGARGTLIARARFGIIRSHAAARDPPRRLRRPSG